MLGTSCLVASSETQGGPISEQVSAWHAVGRAAARTRRVLWPGGLRAADQRWGCVFSRHEGVEELSGARTAVHGTSCRVASRGTVETEFLFSGQVSVCYPMGDRQRACGAFQTSWLVGRTMGRGPERAAARCA